MVNSDQPVHFDFNYTTYSSGVRRKFQAKSLLKMLLSTSFIIFLS